MNIYSINRSARKNLDKWVGIGNYESSCFCVAGLATIALGLTAGASVLNRMPNCVTKRITAKQLILCSSMTILASLVLSSYPSVAKLIAQDEINKSNDITYEIIDATKSK